ncbi:hypothetical protein JCM3770_003606 [Rhodotorula araucariae]
MQPDYEQDAAPILPFSRRGASSTPLLTSTDYGEHVIEQKGGEKGAFVAVRMSEDDRFAPFPPSAGTSRRSSPPSPAVRTPRSKACALAALAFAVGLLLGWHVHRAALQPAPRRDDGALLPALWTAYGDDALSPVGTRERIDVLPSSFNYGLGSGIVVTLQACLIAKMHNYTLVFEEGVNPYGAYYTHFKPASTPGCRVTRALRRPSTYRREDGSATLLGYLLGQDPPSFEVDRVLAGWGSMVLIAHYIRAATFSMPDLAALPPLDSQRPFPLDSNIPPLFHERFLQYSALMREHFSFNTLLRLKVHDTVNELGIQRSREVPVVGVHYRGSDKLVMECQASSQMSCGNITLHCATAYDSLLSPPVALDFPTFNSQTGKARLLLMTTEPDAFSRFSADRFCARHFVVEELARSGTGKAFVQSDFWALTAQEREEDSARMLVQADILANYVDAAVVSANSNTGRTLVFLRGGPQ